MLIGGLCQNALNPSLVKISLAGLNEIAYVETELTLNAITFILLMK